MIRNYYTCKQRYAFWENVSVLQQQMLYFARFLDCCYRNEWLEITIHTNNDMNEWLEITMHANRDMHFEKMWQCCSDGKKITSAAWETGLSIMGGKLRALLQPLNAIVMWWFQGSPQLDSHDASLLDWYSSEWWCSADLVPKFSLSIQSYK